MACPEYAVRAGLPAHGGIATVVTGRVTLAYSSQRRYPHRAVKMLQAFAGEANVLVSEVAGIESTHG